MSRQNNDKSKIEFRLSKKMKDMFEEKCDKEGVNKSEVLRNLIRIYLKTNEFKVLIKNED